MNVPAQARVYKIMFVSGEASGDMYTGAVIEALRENHAGDGKRFDCFGMGLERMKQAGMRQLINASELALAGIAEIVSHYPKIKRAYRRLQQALKEESPDLLVLVDYPDFNLRLAREAHKLGIRTLFYISPQIWAWRKKRIKIIADRIDMMVVIFPFEEKIYLDAGIPVRYVGHPLIDEIRKNLPPHPSDKKGDEKKPAEKTVMLLPGSRMTEVRRLLPVLCRASKKIAAKTPAVNFSLLLAANIPEAFVREKLREYRLECTLVQTHSYAALHNSDVAIAASGTATLQLACCGVPMVIVYKLSWITYALLKKLVKTPFIGMVNIIAGKEIVPELIQQRANADGICREACALLEDDDRRRRIRRELNQVKQALGDGGATKKVARLIREMVDAGKNPPDGHLQTDRR